MEYVIKIINQLTFKQGYYPGLSGCIQYSPMKKKIRVHLRSAFKKEDERDSRKRKPKKFQAGKGLKCTSLLAQMWGPMCKDGQGSGRSYRQTLGDSQQARKS